MHLIGICRAGLNHQCCKPNCKRSVPTDRFHAASRRIRLVRVFLRPLSRSHRWLAAAGVNVACTHCRISETKLTVLRSGSVCNSFSRHTCRSLSSVPSSLPVALCFVREYFNGDAEEYTIANPDQKSRRLKHQVRVRQLLPSCCCRCCFAGPACVAVRRHGSTCPQEAPARSHRQLLCQGDALLRWRADGHLAVPERE